MFIFLSVVIFTNLSSKQIKETLILFEDWGRQWDPPWPPHPNSIGSHKHKPKLTANEIWKLEIDYFLEKYRLDNKQGKIILSWLRKTYPDAPYMLYVAKCESDALIHWKNTNTRELIKRPGGSDSGVLQVNGVHKEDLKKMGLNLNKIEDYFAFVRYLYDKRGVQPWYMSKHCWGEHYQRIKESYI